MKVISQDAMAVVKECAQEFIVSLGYDLVDLKYCNTPYGMMLQLLVDRQAGGITLGECAELNSSLGRLLEERKIINEKYTLEVSSPGVDRPLTEEKDFRRALHYKLHIFLNEPLLGKIEFQGEILSVDGQGICLELNKNNKIMIPFSRIRKAKRVI